MDERAFEKLLTYLRRVPGIDPRIATGGLADGGWYCKFTLDITHPLAWGVVQEFGHVLNGLSLNERLPTVFKPVSPPPYMNGGPGEFLSWVIECEEPGFRPGTCAEWLEGRLPRPVEEESGWERDEDA